MTGGRPADWPRFKVKVFGVKERFTLTLMNFKMNVYVVFRLLGLYNNDFFDDFLGLDTC